MKTLLGERLGGPGAEPEACLDRLDFDGAIAPLTTIDAAIAQAAQEPHLPNPTPIPPFRCNRA